MHLNVIFFIKLGNTRNKEFYLRGYNAIYFVEMQPIFRRNLSTPSPRLKNEPGRKPA
jgi:hypothetical protein